MSEYFHNLEGDLAPTQPGEVIWSHAVNSREKLDRYLHDGATMIIESDIRRSTNGVPVAAHPPETESDLTFEMLIDQMAQSNKGLKLDFKDPEIVTPCLTRLKTKPLTQPVLLNADILQGNGANPSTFSAGGFITECKELYPSGMLSLGWTTTPNPELRYTQENIDEMLTLCENADIRVVTFPVRACLLPKSWNALERLITKDGYTLSIWNNEPVDEELRDWIKNNTDPSKTFYDFIDENKESLRLW